MAKDAAFKLPWLKCYFVKGSFKPIEIFIKLCEGNSSVARHSVLLKFYSLLERYKITPLPSSIVHNS